MGGSSTAPEWLEAEAKQQPGGRCLPWRPQEWILAAATAAAAAAAGGRRAAPGLLIARASPHLLRVLQVELGDVHHGLLALGRHAAHGCGWSLDAPKAWANRAARRLVTGQQAAAALKGSNPLSLAFMQTGMVPPHQRRMQN